MNLEAVYFISQVIAAVALVGSLIFVGLQIREARKQAEHAERTARAQVHQQIAESHRLMSMEWVNKPELFRVMAYGLEEDDLSREQRVAFAGLLASTMRMAENIFFQKENGLISDEDAEPFFDNVLVAISTPVASSWWSQRKSAYRPAFVTFIDDRTSSIKSFSHYAFFQASDGSAAESGTAEEATQ